MKKMMVVCAFAVVGFILFTLATPRPAFGTTRYIAQKAGAFSGGTACNGQTAITPATFNGITNSPGDIDYLCGALSFSASTSNSAIEVNGSGTSGNPITIYFDSGAVISAPYFPSGGSGGAIWVGGSYVTINGNGGAGGATQGVIESTLNGDSGATCPGGPCQYQNDSTGIQASGTGITIEGLSIIDMYVATQPNPGGGACIYTNSTISNWTISNNLMHDMSWCLNLQYGKGSSNITISNNQIYNIDHGVALGGPNSNSSLSNVYVYGNNIHDYSNWDTPGDNWHHDGVHVWGYSDNGSNIISGIYIYNNKFGGCIGANVTAHIFIEANNGGTSNVNIFNNTLIDTCNGVDNDGMLTTGQDGGYKIYNNAFISNSSGNQDICVGTSSSPNVTFINNVVSGCQQGLMYLIGGNVLSGGLHNNIYAAGSGNCASGGSNCFNYGGSSWFGLFSTWQSDTGQDASPSAYVTNAGLNSSGVPQSGSAVINAGANLTSLCSGSLAALCQDITGAARPSTGPWTVGAYSTTGPLPPTSLTGTVQTK